MTYKDAYIKACRKLSVSGPRRARVDLPSGGYVVASLYDGEDDARDAKGRNMLNRIESDALLERSN